jgi:hypothetical protein
MMKTSIVLELKKGCAARLLQSRGEVAAQE